MWLPFHWGSIMRLAKRATCTSCTGRVAQVVINALDLRSGTLSADRPLQILGGLQIEAIGRLDHDPSPAVLFHPNPSRPARQLLVGMRRYLRSSLTSSSRRRQHRGTVLDGSDRGFSWCTGNRDNVTRTHSFMGGQDHYLKYLES